MTETRTALIAAAVAGHLDDDTCRMRRENDWRLDAIQREMAP